MSDAPDTLPARLTHLSRAYAERPAVIFHDRTLTFAEFDGRARALTAGLASLGVSKGTRVGLLMPNRPDWLGCAFAIWRLGAILVPINTLFRAPELACALDHADVTVLIAVSRFLNHDYRAMLLDLCPELHHSAAPLRSAALPCLRHVVFQGDEPPPAATPWSTLCAHDAGDVTVWNAAAAARVVPTDDAAIFFTSGSTATPKGVVHTHRSMLHAADNVGDRLGLTADDRTWGYLPFFFNGGLVGVALATLSRGAAVLLQEAFDAEQTLRLMERHRCTTIFAWPHQAEALVQHPTFDRGKLAIHKGVGANTNWAPRLFPANHQAVGTWGMTETGPLASSTRFDDPLEERAGAHGRPMPGLEFRIVAPDTGDPLPAEREGELTVRGSSVMRTYYKVPPSECFDRDGFFHTGDCARIDAAGLLHFIGRIKDVIKTAGVNVAAAEVEAVLMAHAGIKVAHVVAVAHPTRGENVAAFVVPRDPGVTEADVLEHCRAQLAAYKVPRHVFFVSERELPTLGSGKVDRQALRALANQKTR